MYLLFILELCRSLTWLIKGEVYCLMKQSGACFTNQVVCLRPDDSTLFILEGALKVFLIFSDWLIFTDLLVINIKGFCNFKKHVFKI